jgi:6-pyruvoyltetrahydropterin/6-carboxytetrahydropterin synthase
VRKALPPVCFLIRGVPSMYELKIITQMACAHQLREFEGRCENLHGHNWKIEVFVTGEELEPNGILMDFKRIKSATEKVIDTLDHKFLNGLEYFKEVNPSSENIARYIFKALGPALDSETVRVSRVTAWESDTACASYTEP